jgi:cell division protein FtsW
MIRQKNHIDLPILICVLGLLTASIGLVYSASIPLPLQAAGKSNGHLAGHALRVLAAFGAILLFMSIDYRFYRKLSKPVLLGAILLLLVTFVLGGEVKGAARWLRFGGFSIQPSEFAKYALIFHLAVLISEKKERLRDFKTGFLPMLLWIGTVTVLVLLQPNFSTGAMIFGLSLLMLFLGRARPLHIGLSLAGLLPLLLGYMLSAPYRMRRIMSYLEGGGGSAGGNYQVHQGIIAFGNGGIFGLGPGESRQRDFFLPESYTDFIYSIVGEEYGLIGTMLVMAVFFTIMVRGLRIARNAPDDYGRLLASGITAGVTFYALVNAGVTLGLLPTTGLPMPFISFGGSSMLFTAAAIGVLLNISANTDMYPRMAEVREGGRTAEPVQEIAAGKVYS